MRILVHTCCGPCLIHPLSLLSGRGYQVEAFYFNPNVQPFREYRERYFCALDFARDKGIDFHSGSYLMERFLARVAGDVENRCPRCYQMRLEHTASKAVELGIPEFTTTLLVSPYQEQEMIRRAGEKAASDHGVAFLHEDMSEGYRESARVSREAGMYRQKYCGCVYSEKERFQKSDPPRR